MDQNLSWLIIVNREKIPNFEIKDLVSCYASLNGEPFWIHPAVCVHFQKVNLELGIEKLSIHQYSFERDNYLFMEL